MRVKHFGIKYLDSCGSTKRDSCCSSLQRQHSGRQSPTSSLGMFRGSIRFAFVNH
jgi:hypothetical protein